jgi:hypothetical protein
MIRALVVANDSLVVDAVALLLAQEMNLDVLQLTYELSHDMKGCIRNHHSVVIMIDDGESDTALLPSARSAGDDGPVLLVRASLKAIHLDVCQSYQLGNPRIEQVIGLVRDFSRSHLKEIPEEVATWVI